MLGLSESILRRVLGWRDALTLLVVALLPWQARFIRSYGFLGDASWEGATRGVFATEILLLVALVLHVLSVASGRREKLVPPTWLRFWLLLLLFALFSIVWAPRPETAAASWTHLFEGFALAYLIWVSKKPLRHYAYALVAGGVLNAVLGVWQFLAQSSFASTLLGVSTHAASQSGVSVIETSSGRFLRAYGLSPHPNILGGHLAIALSAAVWLYLDGARRWARPALLGAVMVMLFGLAFSFSRSAWIAYIVVLSVGLGYRYVKRAAEEKTRVGKILGLHLLVGVAVLIIAGPLIATRLGGGTRLERISVDERSIAAYRSLELIRTHYAAGVGIGNMPVAAYEELRPRGEAYGYQPAHHVGLLVAVELGFFGFMMLFGAVIVWLVDARRFFRSAITPLLRGMALLPLVFIVVGFFDHYPVSLYAGTLLVGTAFGLYLKAER